MCAYRVLPILVGKVHHCAPILVFIHRAKIVRIQFAHLRRGFLSATMQYKRQRSPERNDSMMKTEYAHELPASVIINGQALSSTQVLAVARNYMPVTLGSESVSRILAARAVIEKLADEGQTVYGVTTGFGQLSRVRIPHDQLTDLQHNLLRSHGAGVGEPLSEEVTRAMMLLVAASLARGNSGVRTEVVQLLLDMLNARVYPIIPSRGSVGASGDLAPLAHLGLTLIGEGEAMLEGQRYTGAEVLQRAGLAPLHLQAKEGLALINGTHMMEAIAILALADAQSLLRTAEVACAMSIEGLMGSHVPLDARIHMRRGQQGQQVSAARLRKLVSNSEINASHRDCPRVQDPYSMRCAPQVFGAVRDALEYCTNICNRSQLAFKNVGAILQGIAYSAENLGRASHCIGVLYPGAISMAGVDLAITYQFSQSSGADLLPLLAPAHVNTRIQGYVTAHQTLDAHGTCNLCRA